MPDTPQVIADVILDVEANLRAQGKWVQNQPPAGAMSSQWPFCADTLGLEQWLQWVFLPRLKRILEGQQPLPPESGIYEYAREALPAPDTADKRLLMLLKRFDELIARSQASDSQNRIIH